MRARKAAGQVPRVPRGITAMGASRGREPSICQHNRQRSRCKDCGGASILRRALKECTCCSITASGHATARTAGARASASITARSRCKDCGDESICRHNRTRTHSTWTLMGAFVTCALRHT